MNTHTLTLKSTGKAAAARRDVIYSASCSCGMWKMLNVTAKDARAAHDVHQYGADFDGRSRELQP